MAFVPSLPVTSNTPSSTVYGSHRRVFSRVVPKQHRPATVVFGPRMHHGQATIYEYLVTHSQNKTLLKVAEIAGVDLSTISGTLFAPSDKAFERLPKGTLEYLAERPEILKSILLRHVISSVYTSKQISGVGYFEDCAFGGSLAYEALGSVIKIGGQRLNLETCNKECENGIIHEIDGIILPPGFSLPAITQQPVSTASYGDSTIESAYPTPSLGRETVRAFGATLSGTQGGRQAMGLMKQLPFWMYGPPFNASKQEDLEPISLVDQVKSSVDYQLLPNEAVVVTPDEVSGDKLNPVSGMSKYLGKAKRMVEGDGVSGYAQKLDKGM